MARRSQASSSINKKQIEEQSRQESEDSFAIEDLLAVLTSCENTQPQTSTPLTDELFADCSEQWSLSPEDVTSLLEDSFSQLKFF